MGNKVTAIELIRESETFLEGILERLEEEYGPDPQGFVVLAQFTDGLIQAIGPLNMVAKDIVAASLIEGGLEKFLLSRSGCG